MWDVETGELLLDHKQDSTRFRGLLSADGCTLVQLVTPTSSGAFPGAPPRFEHAWERIRPGGSGPDGLGQPQGEQTLWKWDLNRPGSEPTKTTVPEQFARSAASTITLSPNGQTCIISSGISGPLDNRSSAEIRAIDLASGQVGPAVKAPAGAAFEFSPDGTRLYGVSAGAMQTVIWSVAGPELTETLSTPLDSTIVDLNKLTTISFGSGVVRCSDDGRMLAVRFALLNNVCLLIDTATGKVVDTITCRSSIGEFEFKDQSRSLLAFVGADGSDPAGVALRGPGRLGWGNGRSVLQEWVLDPRLLDRLTAPPDGDEADGPAAATQWSPSRRYRAVGYSKSFDTVVQQSDGRELLRIKATPATSDRADRLRRFGPFAFDSQPHSARRRNSSCSRLPMSRPEFTVSTRGRSPGKASHLKLPILGSATSVAVGSRSARTSESRHSPKKAASTSSGSTRSRRSAGWTHPTGRLFSVPMAAWL